MDAQGMKLLVATIDESKDSLAVAVTKAVARDYPALVAGQPTEILTGSVAGNIAAFRDFLASGGDKQYVRGGAPMRAMVRSFTDRRKPLAQLIMLFHGAHNVFEQALLQLTERALVDLSAKDLIAALRDLRALTSQYASLRAQQLAAAYAHEAARLAVSEERQELFEEVTRVLRAPTGADAVGRYSLVGSHVGFVLSVADGSKSPPEDILAVAGDLARGLGSKEEPLAVFLSANVLWGWCRAEEGAELRDTLSAEAAAGLVPDGLRAAIGPRENGPAGFAATHAGAKALHELSRVAAGGPRRRIDIGCEGAWLAAGFVGRGEAATRYVSLYLGELAASSEYAGVIRETARSYLHHGIAGAADHMRAHRNTIKYRVDKFKDAVGEERAPGTDVRVALELAHWFGPAVLQVDASE